MLKIITLVCALLGLLTAVSLESWLRSKIIRSEDTNETLREVRRRNTEFWSSQYLPVFILLVLFGAAIAFGVGIFNAAAFLTGAFLCFFAVIIGSRTVVTGSQSSSSLAAAGNVRDALRTAYRSGAVMGLSVSSISVIGLGILFFILDIDTLTELTASFGLGASIVSLCLGSSGAAFSGAYSLNVKSDDFTDYTGLFVGSGADSAETFVLSVCSATLLAGVGVDTSGVTSTFTATTAARYPLIVLAAGIAASVVGIMIYRGTVFKDPASGISVGNLVAAVIVTVVSGYFSNRMMQTYIYALCVASGIIAAIISAEVSKLFSSDGVIFRKHVPTAKKVGMNQSMIYSMSIGMLSQGLPALFVLAAVIVSYNFANFYGIALAAVGISSIAAVNSAVRGFSINAASASEITTVIDPEAESPSPADVLLSASVHTDNVGKTYSAMGSSITMISMLAVLSVVTDNQRVNLLSISVFAGILTGAVTVLVVAGLIIRSIRLTGIVLRDRLSDSYADEKHIKALRGQIPLYLLSAIVPAAVGFAGGINAVFGFVSSSAVAGMLVLFTINNSGKHFDKLTTEAVGSAVKTIIAASIVFAPVFIKFGGVLF